MPGEKPGPQVKASPRPGSLARPSAAHLPEVPSGRSELREPQGLAPAGSPVLRGGVDPLGAPGAFSGVTSSGEGRSAGARQAPLCLLT